MALHTGQSTSFEDAIYFSSNNPFYVGALVGQCTWYCWSKAHAKKSAYPSRGINTDHIPTSGAGLWVKDAQKYYNIGETPKKDSIAVWTNGSSGHVAYVEDYDPNTSEVCYSEANWYQDTNPSWEIVVDAQYADNIRLNVASHTNKVTVKTTTVNKQKGTDGLFKNAALSTFKEKKKSQNGYECKFIYLTEPKK